MPHRTRDVEEWVDESVRTARKVWLPERSRTYRILDVDAQNTNHRSTLVKDSNSDKKPIAMYR